MGFCDSQVARLHARRQLSWRSLPPHVIPGPRSGTRNPEMACWQLGCNGGFGGFGPQRAESETSFFAALDSGFRCAAPE
jgi:hypothetical protein